MTRRRALMLAVSTLLVALSVVVGIESGWYGTQESVTAEACGPMHGPHPEPELPDGWHPPLLPPEEPAAAELWPYGCSPVVE